jgi:molecular chaperone DnaJ
MKKDFYEILGISKMLLLKKLKKHIEKKQLNFILTKIQGIKKRKKIFKEAAEAYEVLSDAQQKS